MVVSRKLFNVCLISVLTGSTVLHAAEPVKCVELKPGRIFFLAAGVSEEFDCAKRSGRDYWVHKVLEVDGERMKIQNLLDNFVFEEKVGKLCGVASQDEAEAVTRRVVAECKAKQGNR